MAQKRPCEDQLLNGVSAKHPRQMGVGDHNVSHLDTVSVKEASGKHYSSGEESLMVNGSEGRELSANDRTPGSPNGNEEEDNDAGLPRSLSLSPWAASSTSEEDYTLDLAPLPFTTEYFSFDRGAIANDLYCSLLDHPPRKSVPIGPDHQAHVPELSESSSITDEKNDELAGNCIIPRNDLELPPYDGLSIGTGRTDCECVDTGSVRCVRQHIMEAREKLKTTLGQEAFVELGFCEMGEVEAEKWSKNEQQLFHKAVHCNPASMGKNFWSVLPSVFPSRTKMEIVSYYFNVFMLQKRAEQNRHDPVDIDSDNDEWQLSDGDEEEDSVVNHDSNGHIDHPFDDRTYTCSDSGPPAQLPPINTESNKEWQDFILEPCEPKAWNGYSTCGKEEFDFLPTCSMIQEVFGDGSVDADVKRR